MFHKITPQKMIKKNRKLNQLYLARRRQRGVENEKIRLVSNTVKPSNQNTKKTAK